jgi:SAM-dependent methyltransferase
VADLPTYVIRGGLEGRERLRVLSRVLWPTTSALFDRVGIAPDARCLDVGCGGGDVTVALAARVPAGSVVGTDLDATKLDIAHEEASSARVANVEFRVADAIEPPATDERFDVAYVRFVLTHLPDPAGALAAICAHVRPGGRVVVEDIDFRGHFCDPDSAAFRAYVDLYSAAVRSRGCDPDIGGRLPNLLRRAGLVDRGMYVVQPAGFEGEVRLLAPITLEAITDAVVGAGLATEAELHAIIDDLYAFVQEEDTVVSFPRIVQTWGTVAA